jgi:large subunit ribosomal protein L15
MGTTLSTLKPPEGARSSRKRLGRGPGSGRGKTAGKGHKGQKARSGGKVARGFEGGQMPLQRRLPKRGFKNIFRTHVDQVNLDVLDKAFDGGVVDPSVMRDRGVVPRKAAVIKVLGRGELSKALTVKAHRFSEKARQKIEAAGGTVQVLAEQKAPAATPETSAEATE